MKIITGIISCVLLLWGTAYGLPQAFPSSPETPSSLANTRDTLAGNNPPNTSSILIESTEAGIEIHVRNGFLTDVFQEIANHTNIRFNVASQIQNQKVTVDIITKDWDSGIDSLTKGFSRITVRGDRLEIKEILLLGKNNWDPQEDTDTSAFDNLEMARRETDEGEKDSSLSISKLKRLIQIPQGRPLPSNLFDDREIRRYLELKGIHSPDEWEKPGKVRTVLRMAKKELKRVFFEKQIRQKVN